MLSSLSLFTLASVLLAGAVTNAHPVSLSHAQEAASGVARLQYLKATAKSVSTCSKSAAYAAVQHAAVQRRSALHSKLRTGSVNNKQRRQSRRDTTTSLNTNHLSTLTGVTPDTDAATLFASSIQCLLEPDVTEGPYFVSGEIIRNNIAEDQEGVPLYLDLQFVDAQTCEPIPSLYINLWHANSTGVYSGVVASGNGNADDSENLYRTNNRGIYPTDDNGVVQFITTFPGHYTGRTNHIHVSTASGGTVLANNTYSNPVYSHVGQLFFDQSLIYAVEAVEPYATNTQTLTLNSEDSIFATSSASTFDPVVTYALIGDDVSEGVVAWVSMAVDTTQSIDVSAAVFYSGEDTTTSSSSSSSSSSSTSSSSSSSSGPSGSGFTGGSAPSGGFGPQA